MTGRQVTYQPQTLSEAYASRAGHDVEDWRVDAWVSTYTAVQAGEMALVSTDVETLTGHPATSLRELLRARPSGR